MYFQHNPQPRNARTKEQKPRFHMKNWPREPQSGLLLLPFGEFMPASECKEFGERVTRFGQHPVLRGLFDASRICLGANIDRYCGHGTVAPEGRLLLAFRVQVGPDALYWLANLRDAAVWKAIDAWHQAGEMTLVAQFTNLNQAILMQRDFQIGAELERLRPATGVGLNAEDYVKTVARLCVSNGLKRLVTSDLPNHQQLRHVQACMVTTPSCGTVCLPGQS